MLTFNDTEEKAVEKAIAVLADMIPLEAIQPPQSPALVFPGLEIRLHQRRVLKNGADIYLTRLEYGALCYLAASPGRVFTKAQIFESVWSIGKYGRMHREYLREVHPARFSILVLNGELWTYLADLNEQAQERLDTIMEQMKATEGVTEELKRTSQMEWVQCCNNIHNRAEEIVLHEMIYS